MDGNTSITSRASALGRKKKEGILVVVAAGNDGSKAAGNSITTPLMPTAH